MFYLNKDAKVRKIDDTLKIIDLFVESGEPFDFVVGELNGFHGSFINHLSDKYYFILSGEAEVLISEEKVTVREGDFVHIPIHTKHYISGKCKFVIMCKPQYDYKTEVVF